MTRGINPTLVGKKKEKVRTPGGYLRIAPDECYEQGLDLLSRPDQNFRCYPL